MIWSFPKFLSDLIYYGNRLQGCKYRIRSFLKNFVTGIICCFSVILQANEREYFFSPTGEDRLDCKAGNRSNPWRSLALQYKQGCIQPGSKVYFKAGIYDSGSDVFRGRINLYGSKDNPIFILADPKSNKPWPVKFQGDFIISNAENIIIDGIDFVRGKNKKYALAIGASNITIKNSRIRGLDNSYNQFSPSMGDCIKIAGGSKIVRNIKILKNEIYNCSQDAIDITGRKDILIKDNHIHDAWIMQIKGGAENITYDGNNIHDMRYGITGNGMDCSKNNIYCGSPVLPKLSVNDRYEANNVTIKNNTFRNILMGRVIDFTGWRNVAIQDNLITNGNIISGSVIMARDNVGTVFLDDMAKHYCENKPDGCIKCRLANGSHCWKIKLKAKNISLINNTIENK